jgi:hypothetical protein
MAPRYPLQRARAFAARVDVDVRQSNICLACLSFVSWPVGEGDGREALSWTRRLTPDLWDEGLPEYVLPLVREAVAAGVPDAERALADLEAKGARSAVARAFVLRLAEDLAQRTRIETRLEAAARARLELAPPELN